MKVTLLNQPGNTAAKVSLVPGEVCIAEAGSMIAMSAHTQVTTTTHKKGKGSLLKGAKRMLSGESFFLNHYEAKDKPSDIFLGTGLCGDMLTLNLDKAHLIVQSGSFLACEQSVEMDFGWQGFKSLFSGESVFWLTLSGSGTLVLSAFGAIYPVQVNGEYIVDSGHIVAFDESLDFSITKAGNSWVHSFLGGEGLVCKFHGSGTVWCQSHNPHKLGLALTPNLRAR